MSADGTDPGTGGQAFEMGRLVQATATMQQSVSRIEGKLDNVATKADIAEVRALALTALERANHANTRLDTHSAAARPWIQIGMAVLTALVMIGLGIAAIGRSL